MQILKLRKGDRLAKRGEKVSNWYVIQTGQVVQCCRVEELLLKENFVIGMLEEDFFWCDYIAKSEVSVIVLPRQDAGGLKKLLAEMPAFRGMFLSSTLMHKHRELMLYSSLVKNTRSYYDTLQSCYESYQTLCDELSLEELKFPEFSNLTPIQLVHRAEGWEVNQSNSLMRGMITEYLHVVEKDEDLVVGCIMETGRSLKRICQGIDEMDAYLYDQKDILLCERGMDMFGLFFDLSVRAAKSGADITKIRNILDELCDWIKNLNIYDESLVARRMSEYRNFDYEHPDIDANMDVLPQDFFTYVLTFADYEPADIREKKAIFDSYAGMEGMDRDKELVKLKRSIINTFYDVYEKCFFKAAETGNLPAAISMFLNFGVLDQDQLNDELMNELFAATRRLSRFNTDHVFTMFEWLMKIYNGERMPSKNEFDLDYDGWLKEKKKNGEMDDAVIAKMRRSSRQRVIFEIRNLFESGQRITYGKITTFVPMLRAVDMINTPSKMAVTAEKINDAVNEIRAIDFSLLYRQVLFEDNEHGVKSEMIQVEVMPDMILMPNCGTKAAMWQETSGVRRDSPARFIFPIFTIADLPDMMLANMGRYRWEICRRIQGVHWNDIREKSLTSEYSDYIQFYKKNRDLSQEAKEKLKMSLTRAKNSYREVFVMDYVNWIKYESAGGFRLNKVSRDILIKYCPFAKNIRNYLKSNPMFGNTFAKFEADQTKEHTHFKAVNDKLEKAGGTVTKALKENLIYYEM